jgi:peptide/nickel transport system permease protein
LIAAPAKPLVEGPSLPRQKMVRRWSSTQVLGLVGLAALGCIVATAIAAPFLAPADPVAQDVLNRLKPPFWASGGSLRWPLGTDQLGRDLLSRVIFGSRVSLTVSIFASLLATAVGVALGLIAGYSDSGWSKAIVALADAQLAFPVILLAIGVVGALGASLANLILVLTVSTWVVFARLVRGTVLSLREHEFVTASRTIGASDLRIVVRHILPQVLNSIVVMSTLTFGRLIVFEAGLSFLGLGVPPPTPTWGGILADGRSYLETAPWIATVPGVLITATVLAVNFLGDGLRYTFDRRTRREVWSEPA